MWHRPWRDRCNNIKHIHIVSEPVCYRNLSKRQRAQYCHKWFTTVFFYTRHVHSDIVTPSFFRNSFHALQLSFFELQSLRFFRNVILNCVILVSDFDLGFWITIFEFRFWILNFDFGFRFQFLKSFLFCVCQNRFLEDSGAFSGDRFLHLIIYQPEIARTTHNTRMFVQCFQDNWLRRSPGRIY